MSTLRQLGMAAWSDNPIHTVIVADDLEDGAILLFEDGSSVVLSEPDNMTITLETIDDIAIWADGDGYPHVYTGFQVARYTHIEEVL